jgi:hypothetical protein
MKYVVVTDFTDKNDKHIYRVGDEFPHSGADVSAERVAELTSKDNMRGEVLIKALQESKIQPEKEETDKVEEVAAPKKKTAKKANKKEK